MSTTTIKGNAAIEMAVEKGLTLNKYADPTEGARSGLSVEEARELAKQDPSLVYLTVEMTTFTITTECGSDDIDATSANEAAAKFAAREGWKDIADVESLSEKWMRKGTTFVINGDDGYHFQVQA